MAFVSRIGNALRRTSVSTSSPLLQPVRCMSSSKLFVGGLSYATDETTLKNFFSPFGNVLEARIIADRESGRSKGFGFITYASTEEASAAMTNMDGKELQGRNIRVDHANDRAGGIRGGGGFGSGGSYSAGGGYPTGGYGGSSGYSSGGGGGYNSGGYAGNGGYGVGSGSGYGGNYNNASGSGYSGNDGYGAGAASGGYANNLSSGYGSSGRYNTTGSSDGDTAGYHSSPNTYGAGNYGAANYNTGSSSGGTSGKFGGDLSGGRFGGNFTGNVTGGGYSGSSTGEFYGGRAGYGANKPQDNGQGDLPAGFFDKEVAEMT